mmetsp:Transcript_29973/g.87282  ORF Transcript_29973/g.87282 Transcript_29973/m.87282 type:complete len:204 (-) Transcript_29973:1332-1943(-)
MSVSDGPSTTKARCSVLISASWGPSCSFPLPPKHGEVIRSHRWRRPGVVDNVWWDLKRSMSRSVTGARPSPSFSLSRVIMSMSLVRSLQEKPMLMAVAILSPVRTQSLIPALFRFAIVSGTPSWRRSSMAVAPMRTSSFSMSAAALGISSSRSFEVAAAFQVSSQSSASALDRVFMARTSVRRPSVAKISRWFSRIFLSPTRE